MNKPHSVRAVLVLVGWSVAVAAAAKPVAAEQAAAEQAAAVKTNVILLLADDLGWTGLRCFGSDFYETPHLDQMATQGVKFTAAYSACTVCSPTRAALMTGLYPARLHLTDFIAGQNRPFARLRIPDWTKHLDHRHVTIAERLRKVGYTTAQVGKWHLAARSDPRNGGPDRHGFDIVHPRPPRTRGYRLPRGLNSKGESGSDYLTDYLTDKAVEVIDQNHDRPFFLYFAYNTPHTPIQGRADLVARFQKKVRADAIHKNPEYAAMVHSLDQSVGRILARLDKHGIAEQTVVIFVSDNGGLTQRYGKHDGFTENLPLRRGKGSAYEGGVRVPMIVRWPKTAAAGSVCRAPVISMDLHATIADIAGASPAKPTELDGVSLVAQLKQPQTPLDRPLYWHYPHYHAGGDSPYTAVRQGPWRLIEFHETPDQVALYNLDDDPGEKTNVAAQHPDRARKLHAQLRAWRRKLNAQMPTNNPDFDPARQTQVRRSR